jgi:hypothetical protein
MKRLYLTLDDRLFEEILTVAETKGIPPTSLVVGNLEDLYLRNEAVDYEGLLNTLCEEAKQKPCDEPFLLAELPSFGDLIISSAEKAHISPSPVRARIGKSFNAAVRNKKVGNVKRATRSDGQPLNKAGVAMYVNSSVKAQQEG